MHVVRGADLIGAAAGGRLPDWSEASPARRAHMDRVARLMDGWAGDLKLDADERVRWRAAAWLHDALRDGDPDRLRRLLPPGQRDLPDPILHGPACAARLAADGVRDEAIRFAVAYHTLGHPDLDDMGRFLYLADFLEPGRDFEVEWRAALRDRLPGEVDDVLPEVVRARLLHLIGRGGAVRPETMHFWNALVAAA